SSRRRHTRSKRDWSSDVCSSDLTPPNLGGSWRSGLRALALGGKLALLPRRAQRDLWDLVTRSAGVLLDWWFESDPIKAAFGFDEIGRASCRERVEIAGGARGCER